MHKIELLSHDKLEKIKIVSFMKDYYLSKGYLELEKNNLNKKYLLKFYYKIFKKVKIIYNLIYYSKFKFKDPSKKNIIIYDCENKDQLLQVVPKDDYEIISNRINKIKKIYISKKIITYIFRNFLKRSLKQNYIAALIKIISPKVVITNVENSSDFHISAKIFANSKIKFLAVQNSFWVKQEIALIDQAVGIYIPEFLCFSEYEEQVFSKKICDVKKFSVIGSLRSSLAREYVKKNNININPDKYDICLISEPNAQMIPEFEYIDKFEEAPGIIAEYTHRLCKNKNLKLVFSGKNKIGEDFSDEEIYYYKEFLKHYDFKISQSKREDYGTSINVMQSKLVIGHFSTVLREAVSFKKKVLVYNFTGHPDVIYPSGGLCILNNSSYDEFEKRVLEILSLNTTQYEDKLSKKMDFIMSGKSDTADHLRERLKEIIG